MIIELGIKCYNNFPGIPRYFDFMEMLVSNFSPGSAQYFYDSDIAYEEGSITGETWTPIDAHHHAPVGVFATYFGRTF